MVRIAMNWVATAFQLTIFWVVIISLVVASPQAPSRTEGLHLSALPNLPNEDFRYGRTFTGHPLPKLACIMAGVAAMHDLAMLDRDEHINPTRKRTHPNYPGAFLNFAPFGKEGGRITVRWAMFLVNAATQAMMRQQRYETSVFFGWYKGVGVGSILFNRATADSVDVPTTTSIEPQKLQNLLPATDPHLLPRPSIVARDTGTSFNVTGTRLAAGDQLYAQVDFVGKTMDMRDALMAIIYLLMSLGGRHNQPLGFYNCIMHAVTVEVRTIFNRIDDPRHATYDLTSG